MHLALLLMLNDRDHPTHRPESNLTNVRYYFTFTLNVFDHVWETFDAKRVSMTLRNSEFLECAFRAETDC